MPTTIKIAIFYGSYLCVPVALALAALAVRRAGPVRIACLAMLAALAVPVYARFAEPKILLTRTHDLRIEACTARDHAPVSVRVAVVADMHWGIFKNAIAASRIAPRLRALDVDVVLMPGDFTYHLPPAAIADAVAPLGDVGAPAFAVTGNHDVGAPDGPDVGWPLTAALLNAGVDVVDNRVDRSFVAMGGGVEIAGLSDLWEGRQDYTALEARPAAPRIVVTHNPETVLEPELAGKADLVVAGHTHGGQIYLPGLSCLLSPHACGAARTGFTNAYAVPLFVTSGTGMTVLPMRFNQPPRIDVLNVAFQTCSSTDEPLRRNARDGSASG
ncbi:MAG: metallophosphoesterase [Pseudomonadota bacterium]